MLKRPDTCRGCVLDENHLCSGYAPPFGRGSLGVMVVAEALGQHEASEGRPLVPKAQAGSIFARALRRMSLDEQQFVFMNAVNCRPHDNRLDGEWYEEAAIDHCRRHIDKAVERFKPRAILALGNVPLRALTGITGQGRSVTSLRGYCLPAAAYRGGAGSPLPVVAAYHPSFISRGQEKYLGVLMHDIGKAIKCAQGRLLEERDYTFDLKETRLLKHWVGAQIPAEKLDELLRLSQDPTHIIPYDIETNWTKGRRAEDEYEVKTDDAITHIQFGLKKGEALILPWDEDALNFTRRVMAGRAATIGHNAWRFDYRKLFSAGVTVWNGPRLDSMTAFHHIQPDLPANLETVGSIYGAIAPWKYLETHDPVYMGMDVDVLFYVLDQLPSDMRKRGVWDSYLEMVVALQPELEGMQLRGLRIDLDRRERFAVKLETQKAETDDLIQTIIPAGAKPQQVYKDWPDTVRPYISGLSSDYAVVGPRGGKTKAVMKLRPELCTLPQHRALLPEELNQVIGILRATGETWNYSRAGLVRTDPFLPNSSDQLKNLIRHYGEPVPLSLDWEETTARPELEKFLERLERDAKKLREMKRGKEEHRVKADQKDLLRKQIESVITFRRLSKIKSTYVDGWKTDEAGYVRTTFTHRSATWQLTSIEPNVQNGPAHGDLAQEWLMCQVASPGCTIVALDYGGCHLKTLAFEMEDRKYYEMACIDGHSTIGMLALKMITPEQLFEMEEGEWRERCAHFRSDPEREMLRAKRFKPALLGIQLGLMGRKLWDMNRKHFTGEDDAQRLIDTIKAVFPKIPAWQKAIRDQAYTQGYLLSRYGGIRWFWSMRKWDAKQQKEVPGDDTEAALAFPVQNDAFGKKRESMLDLAKLGLTEKYRMYNDIHDAAYFDCPNEYVEEAIHECKRVMELPARKLVNSTFPGGLVIQVEVKVGPSLGELKKVKV